MLSLRKSGLLYLILALYALLLYINVTFQQEGNIMNSNYKSDRDRHKGQARKKPFGSLMKDQQVNGQFPLTRRQIGKLLDNAPSVRDRAIISIMAYCGLRREEVASMSKDSVNYENKLITIVGKGNKRRQVPLPDFVAQEIRWYIRTITGKKTRSKWMFPAVKKKDGPICTQQINRMLSMTGKMARIQNPNPKLKSINPHCLRHTYARILKRKGVDLFSIGQAMGHSDPRSTEKHYGVPSVFEIKKRVLKAMEA